MSGNGQSFLENFDEDCVVWVCKIDGCGFVAMNKVLRDLHEHQYWQQWHLTPYQIECLPLKIASVDPLITKEDLARARPNYKLKSKKGKRLQERLK